LLGASLRPALVLLPDTVFHPESPALRLINALARDFDFSVAVERVDEDQVSRYGIVEWDEATGRIMRILEKPSPAETASRWAIAARFAIGPRTLHHLQTGFRAHPQEDGEAQLTPFLNSALGRGHIGIAVPLGPEEQRFDCGNPQSYRRACEVLDGL
jgi:UTP-glucose-1-phosphate uridylyltransferase